MPWEDTMEQKSRHELRRQSGTTDSVENAAISIPEGSLKIWFIDGTEIVSTPAIP